MADNTLISNGSTIDGEKCLGMQVTLDRQQGANAWLTIGLREGKNRELRRATAAVGLPVNRLLRVSYGPFRLGDLKAGAVEEVKGRVLADQMGWNDKPKPQRKRKPVRRRNDPR